MKKYNISIVGSTGLVGKTFVNIINESDLPIGKIIFYASLKSKGKIINYKNDEYKVDVLNNNSFKNMDFVFFFAGSKVSSQYGEVAEKRGAIVIDNSSYFRNNKDIPLIVPEINIEDFFTSKRRIIANPNCSTIQSIVPIYAISKKYKIKSINYSTYQSISGAGYNAILDYYNSLNNKESTYFNIDIKNTCIPFIGDILDNNYTSEEMKMINETKKILHLNNEIVNATCIRVPVLYCHGVLIELELDSNFEVEDINKLLRSFNNIKILDDIKNNIYPNSITSFNNDYIYVGRIRKHIAKKNTVLLYCVSDNLRKGDASNALEIFKKIIKS